jgi:hypothetical protein
MLIFNCLIIVGYILLQIAEKIKSVLNIKFKHYSSLFYIEYRFVIKHETSYFSDI